MPELLETCPFCGDPNGVQLNSGDEEYLSDGAETDADCIKCGNAVDVVWHLSWWVEVEVPRRTVDEVQP